MNNFLIKVDTFTKKAKEYSIEKKTEILKSFKGYQSPNSLKSGVFGVEIAEAVRISETRGLPTVVANTLEFLNRHTEEVGLYRVSASIKEINALTKEFQNSQNYEISSTADIHAVAAILKMYYRELPSPLITDDVKKLFYDTHHSQNSVDLKPKSDLDSITNLTNACKFLPRENRLLAHALFSHLNQVMNNSQLNKMSVLNLQLIFSPCLNLEPALVNLFIKYPEILENKTDQPVQPVPVVEKNYSLKESVKSSVKSSLNISNQVIAPQKPIRKTAV